MTLYVRRALAVLSIGALGCSSDLLLPAPGGSQNIGGLTKENGDEQSGPVGETLPKHLEVKVLTESGEPVSGVQVSFELADPNGGTVDPATSTTNTSGIAVTSWTLGTVPGTYIVSARLSEVEPEVEHIAAFSATAHPGSPDTLSPLIPLAQPGQRNEPVEDRPRVRVVDRFGNLVPNVPVAWQVISGEGRVSSPITTTDPEGTASVEWTLGNRIGVHKLTAAIESAVGSPVTFTAATFF
jgi:hypothetical protein